MKKSVLSAQKCVSCEGEIRALTATQAKSLLKTLEGWQLKGRAISKTFKFRNYYETVAFVNAVAWIAHAEDHHPDIAFGYKQCNVNYSTHAVKGLSLNDFICASKIDALGVKKV